MKRIAAALLSLLALAVSYWSFAPDRFHLGRPLDLTQEPTFVTDWKLQLADDATCFGALDKAGIDLERLPDEEKGEGCVFESVARLEQSLISWGGGVTLRCPMLAGLALWERHTLQPLAEAMLNQKIIRIRHFGTYACRNINNASSGRRSQHASANAIDIAGFVLADGSEVSVLEDWGKETPRGEFLRQVRDQACRRFSTVLGPDYNALHANHFHFDNGGFRICR